MADQLPGICWEAATDLFGWAKEHAAYLLKLKKNLTSLQSKLGQLENIHKDVEAIIERAESNADMRKTNEVNAWLHDVQNLQQIIKDIEAQGSQEIHNTCLSGCCPKNYVSSYKIGRKIVKKILEVDGLVTSGRRFTDNRALIADKLRPLVYEIPFGEIVGSELMLNTVWNSLKDENVGIIGFYGMGGAGKTTLMKRVNNELGKRRDHGFELVLWVVISKDCNINKVMNDIRNRIGIENDFWESSSEEQRLAKIYSVLKQKRFVLMLDDLWGKLELERMGVPYPKDINCQSKVVLTSRYEDVCDKMQVDKKFKVECLLEEEAFDLFCKKVGEKTLKCHREIPKLAREMAKKCAGLPLALITIGSAMAGVKSIESWRQAKNDFLTRHDLGEQVFSILKFSYDRLPDDTHKRCFLYCALYPEDYKIEVEMLIDRWIREGFLDKGKYVSIYEMHDEGRSIIEKLKLSSLLEDATDRYWPFAIKMHDVIRDMALWLARDQDENTDKVVVESKAVAMDSKRSNVTERISVIGVRGTWQQVPVCPNLLTLCVQKDLKIIEFSNLQCMKVLKVLDLSRNRHIKYLPIEIGKLINLEFLNISCMRNLCSSLPIELKNLKKLRVFLMEHTYTKIPLVVFEGLEQLQVFRASRFETNEILLLQKLEHLPELKELGIYLGTNTGMHKLLLNPNKLQGCLRKFGLTGIDNNPVEMASLLASWSTMKHLEFIELFRIHDIREIPSIAHTCHFDKLRGLVICECHSITHLTWLRYAPFLEFLGVARCSSIEEVVERGQDEDEDDVDTDLFSNLRCLAFFDSPKLKSIHNRALPFPSLKSIHIAECPNLRKLPLNSNSAKDTLIEIEGEPKWWDDLEWDDPAIKDLFYSKFKLFTFLYSTATFF